MLRLLFGKLKPYLYLFGSLLIAALTLGAYGMGRKHDEAADLKKIIKTKKEVDKLEKEIDDASADDIVSSISRK